MKRYPPISQRDISRFWRKVEKTGPNGCWTWLGYHDKAGYCPFLWGGKLSYAHIFSFLLHKGPIPEGCEVDHKCRNRGCPNPDHHRPLTHRANVLAGNTTPARHAAQTHCLRGHEFTPENTYLNPRGERQCRQCISLREKRLHQQRQRESQPQFQFA